MDWKKETLEITDIDSDKDKNVTITVIDSHGNEYPEIK